MSEEPKHLEPTAELTSLFNRIDIRDVKDNLVKLVWNDWHLISAGNQESFNGMTACWGGFGVWDRPFAVVFVHPNRYTYDFMEREDYFTLAFFDMKYRPALEFYGKNSGRDFDKPKEAGLTPLWMNPGMAYKEASLIVLAKKWYADKSKLECFWPPTGEVSGPEDKRHKIYFGQIVSVWQSKP